jgi:putative glutamine amidotransferase
MSPDLSVRSDARPVVLVPACNRMLSHHCFHMAAKQYVDAVWLAGARPFIVPHAQAGEIDQLLSIAHGVLLTGSPSNVDPSYFNENVLDESLPLDPIRDAWTLPVVRRAVQVGLPLLAICRGFQEANVALGGTLHQAVHLVEGYADHRDRDDDAIEVQYGIAHEVEIVPGGLLDGLLGERRIGVNSLHGQGVNRLAPGLSIEARAPDGLVEAFSCPASPGFMLGVQWHPEWNPEGNPISQRLLCAFGEAAHRYHLAHRRSAACPMETA